MMSDSKRTVRAVSELDQPHVSMLQVRSEHAAGDEIRQFLTQICHPMDIAFESAGGTEAIVLGLTREPGRWSARIQRHAAGRDARGDASRVGPLDIVVHGPWLATDLPSDLHEIIDPFPRGAQHVHVHTDC